MAPGAHLHHLPHCILILCIRLKSFLDSQYPRLFLAQRRTSVSAQRDTFNVANATWNGCLISSQPQPSDQCTLLSARGVPERGARAWVRRGGEPERVSWPSGSVLFEAEEFRPFRTLSISFILGEPAPCPWTTSPNPGFQILLTVEGTDPCRVPSKENLSLMPRIGALWREKGAG